MAPSLMIKEATFCTRQLCHRLVDYSQRARYRFHSFQHFSTSDRRDEHRYDGGNRRRSPYSVLNLQTNASVQDIKQAFRMLAKQYHPDLNPNISPKVSQNKMAEIIEAYSQLMDDDYLGVKVGDGRVALAAEIYTLEELQMDNLHDVYTIKILYDSDVGNIKNDDEGEIKEEVQNRNESLDEMQLSTESVIEIMAHPEDSVSDLKRAIQKRYEEEWGLSGRRMDRDKIRTGWELLCLNRRKQEAKSSNRANHDHDHLVMSYHLFLHSYGIQHSDLIYAVVRKTC